MLARTDDPGRRCRGRCVSHATQARNPSGRRPLSVSSDRIAVPAMRCAAILAEVARRPGGRAPHPPADARPAEARPDRGLDPPAERRARWADAPAPPLGLGLAGDRQYLGDRRASAALAAGLDLLAAVLAPPGRAHPEETVGEAGHRAEHRSM